MDFDSLGIGNKSIKIANEKPIAWEYRLFAQVLIDEVEAIKKAFQKGYRTKFDKLEVVEIIRIPSWAQDRINEYSNMIRQLQTVFDSSQEDAFGPDGNVEKIVTFSRKIALYYYRANVWAQELKSTPIDERYKDISSELAEFAASTTDGRAIWT